MIQIRSGVFETNSSSTHSMIICTKEEYEKLLSGELYVDQWGDTIFTREEAIEKVKKNRRGADVSYLEGLDKDAFLKELEDWAEIVPFDVWKEDLNHDRYEFTTPSGDEMVAICAYGYDY